MNYKKGVNFLIISVLFLLGAYLATGGMDITNSGTEASWTHLNITSNGTVASGAIGGAASYYLTDNVIKNGTYYVFNFTIVIMDSYYNMTNLTITLPNNMTVGGEPLAYADILKTSWVNSSSIHLPVYNISGNTTTGLVNHLQNITFKGEGSGGWNYDNATYFNIWFNASMNMSGDWDDAIHMFKITANMFNGTGGGYANVTYINFTVDSAAPRIWGINVSDGNHTWTEEFLNKSYHLVSTSDLFIEAMINETHLNTSDSARWNGIYLYYYTNSTAGAQVNVTETFTPAGGHYRENGTITGSSSPYKINFTIPAGTLVDLNVTTFIITANDTLEQKGTISFFSFNLSKDVIRFGRLNVTVYENMKVETDLVSRTFVKEDYDIAINVTLHGHNINVTNGSNKILTETSPTQVRIYWNASSGRGFANETDKYVIMTTNSSGGATLGEITNMAYNVTFTRTGDQNNGTWNDTTTVHFLIVANDSLGYKTYTVDYNFTIDGKAPTAAIATDDSDNSITLGNSIKLTCTSTDSTNDPTVTYRNYYSYGGGESWISENSYTFTPTASGTYTIKCDATDSTGHTGVSTETTFLVTRSSTSETEITGDSGGGSGKKSVSVFTGQTRDLGDIIGGEGTINAYRASTATFTVTTSLGTTPSSHSITFDTVSFVEGQATITISSDPITLTMNVGDVETVDVDGDGVNDLEITLNNIDSDGKVNMNVKDLIGETTTEGGEPTGEEGEPTGEITEGGMSWIWWVIIIIVIIVIIALILPKKK